MSWINTSDRKPTGIEPVSLYPFATDKDSFADPHYGFRVGDTWCCEVCGEAFQDEEVQAWFDLPPYEPQSTTSHLITCSLCQTVGGHETKACPHRFLFGL